jgi:DNA-binding LacI/PurR family transcriptional regulator
VLIDSSPVPDMATIEIDDEAGAYHAAKHLVDLGHREVLIVGIESTPATPPAPDGISGRRLRGYQRGLGAAGIDPADAHLVVGSPTVEGGIAAFRRTWEDGLRPTAALVMSDAMAIGVLRAARDLGLSVPDDLSVVGFDDIEMSRHTCPPLTTVHQPIRVKGQTAVRMLLSMIDGEEPRPPSVVLQTRLVVRHSTAPPHERGAAR